MLAQCLHILFLKITLYLCIVFWTDIKQASVLHLENLSKIQWGPDGAVCSVWKAAAMWGKGFGHLAEAISLVISSLCCPEGKVNRQQTGDRGQVRGHNWALLIGRVDQGSKEERKATGKVFVLCSKGMGMLSSSPICFLSLVPDIRYWPPRVFPQTEAWTSGTVG